MTSLWTEDDQKILAELVRKRGFADVALGLRNIAWTRHEIGAAPTHADWSGISGYLTRIFDNIAEKRPLKDG